MIRAWLVGSQRPWLPPFLTRPMYRACSVLPLPYSTPDAAACHRLAISKPLGGPFWGHLGPGCHKAARHWRRGGGPSPAGRPAVKPGRKPSHRLWMEIREKQELTDASAEHQPGGGWICCRKASAPAVWGEQELQARSDRVDERPHPGDAPEEGTEAFWPPGALTWQKGDP